MPASIQAGGATAYIARVFECLEFNSSGYFHRGLLPTAFTFFSGIQGRRRQVNIASALEYAVSLLVIIMKCSGQFLVYD